MIAHIFQSGSSFIEAGIQCFRRAGISSEYFIFSKGEKKINRIDFSAPVKQIDVTSDEFTLWLSSLQSSDYTLFLFHGLFKLNAFIARKIFSEKQTTQKLAWFIYGSEIEDQFIFPGRFMGPRTRLMYFIHRPYRLFFPVLKIFSRVSGNSFKAIVQKMDYFVHFMPEEITFIEEAVGVSKPRLWFSYLMLEDFVLQSTTEYMEKDGTLIIGNSSGYNTNIAEAILLIKNSKFRGTVKVPLGYGNHSYRKYLLKLGRKSLKTRFIAICDLIPRDEYNKLLGSSSFLMINSHKQLALANILVAAYLGSRIYLNELTATYRYLTRVGIIVSSMQEVIKTDKDPFQPLNNLEVEKNKSILKEIFGAENASKRILDSFKEFS